ncbi:hypothetical protein SRHO_G00050620 [Serrasalmus rhombeus]
MSTICMFDQQEWFSSSSTLSTSARRVLELKRLRKPQPPFPSISYHSFLSAARMADCKTKKKKTIRYTRVRGTGY